MKTVHLTTSEIDCLKAAAANQLANLKFAHQQAETIAAAENIAWLEMVTQSAVDALGRAE